MSHTQNTGAVPLHEVFELTFLHDETYSNLFLDVEETNAETDPLDRLSFPVGREMSR